MRVLSKDYAAIAPRNNGGMIVSGGLIQIRKHFLKLCRFEDITDERLRISNVNRAVELFCLYDDADKKADGHAVDEHQFLEFEHDVFLYGLKVGRNLIEKARR